MDGWMEFLEARMRVIKAAVKAGKTIVEIESLINIKDTQSTLLIQHAKNEIEKEKNS